MADKNSQFVALEGIEMGNRFFTTNNPDSDVTTLKSGEIAYRILGYADTVEEAHDIIYGGDPIQLLENTRNYLNRQRQAEWGDNPPERILQMDALTMGVHAEFLIKRQMEKFLA